MRTKTLTPTKPMQAALVIALILTLVLPFLLPSSAKTGFNIQPALLQMAEEDPDQTVRLIVQKTDDSQMAEAVAARLGGEVVADLSMIHAFAAEMTAANAVQLARSGTVRWVSLDAPVESAGKPQPPPPDEPPPQSTQNYYRYTTFQDDLTGYKVNRQQIDGSGITVAIIDSGVDKHDDFGKRVAFQKSFTILSNSVTDVYGHGTHVAGIVGGDGSLSYGDYAGMATGVELIGLKIANGGGMAYESDVVAAMQWVYDYKDTYNIRIVNISLNSTVDSSYHQSPMSAAAEILWFNGVVVVASVGNVVDGMNYNPALASPAHDPFVITVGATDEAGSGNTNDDFIAGYSAAGTTLDGFAKPDIYAPGTNIVSPLSKSSDWNVQAPERCQMYCTYFRLSGTSMAAPMVTGAVALLLQDEPNLTPDQVKFRLLNTAGSVNEQPYLDVYSAVMGTTTGSANTGLEASQLLWTGDEPVVWGSVAWNSVAWNSVAWNSVAWNSVAWNSVAWNSVAWNE